MYLIIVFSLFISSNLFANDRVDGFVFGAFLGEAYGGPHEFQPTKPLALPQNPSSSDWGKYGDQLKLLDYSIAPSDYGHWEESGAKGSLTDETRHKIIYLNSVKTKKGVAQSYVQFSKKSPRWKSWLSEYNKAAMWVLGYRDPSLALPTERLWGGMSTQAGQMIFLFESINHIENPEQAYLDVWNMNWVDQAQAKDVTSTTVALSSLLLSGKKFQESLDEVKNIDPFKFNKVLYVPRRVNVLIDQALSISKRAKGNPHLLFKLFNQELKAVTWWEDYVPFMMSITLIDFIGLEHPHAAIKLANDFGHDTDSVASLLAAWLGAIHNKAVFNASDLEIVEQRLKLEYNYSFKNFIQH